MRTLHFDTELAWRGGQQQVLLLARGLARRSVGVTLVAPAASALFERARDASLPVEPLAARGDLDLAAALRLARLLRTGNFDLIHCHTAHAHGVALLGRRFLTRAGRPKLVVSRRVAFSSASSFLTRRKFCGADLILAVSQAVRKGLIDAGIEPVRVAVVRDGIALERQPVDPAERERIRRLFRLAHADRLVLHLAHLGAEKGQADLIAAAPRIHAAVSNACIAIVGQGAMRERLERQAASLGTRIFFVGFWPPERVPALLAAADVFVLPSRREGLGSVLFEAMAAGLPVAASRTGGIPEIVSDDETGLLVPPGDPSALADAVVRLLTDPRLSARLTAAALEFVRLEGSAERMIDQTLAAYRAMLDSRAS